MRDKTELKINEHDPVLAAFAAFFRARVQAEAQGLNAQAAEAAAIAQIREQTGIDLTALLSQPTDD